MKRILICEDEDTIREFVVINLKRAGYDVVDVNSGEAALKTFETEHGNFDIVLLDIMMPGIDGFTVCKKIREKSSTIGIIMLTARTQEMDKVSGLMIGADDYIEKPFSFPVLSSKIKALIRRSYDMREEKDILVYKDISMNVQERTVIKNGESLHITGKEFDILEYFMRHPETVIQKEKLFDEIWGSDCFSEMNTLNVYIRWLREKLENDPKCPELIQTVWKVGYKFGGTKE